MCPCRSFVVFRRVWVRVVFRGVDVIGVRPVVTEKYEKDSL